MSDAYLGEIRLFSGNYVPAGWLPCDGRLLPVSDPYDVLFILLSNTYGGNGLSNFALPDLRGRVPVSSGQGAGLTDRLPGQMGGSETASLSVYQIPAHTHPAQCSTSGGNLNAAAGAVWARQLSGVTAAYQSAAPDTAMGVYAIGNTGGGSGHENMQPFVTVTYMINYIGIYPAQP